MSREGKLAKVREGGGHRCWPRSVEPPGNGSLTCQKVTENACARTERWLVWGGEKVFRKFSEDKTGDWKKQAIHKEAFCS